jgi:hypothetical protein
MYLIGKLAELDATPGHWLYGAIAVTEGVGLSGHSFGSFTSITVAGLDRRVRAIVPQAAPGINGWNWPRTATLFMLATEDDTVGELNSWVRAAYDVAPEPKALFELLDAGHFTYSNLCDIFPAYGDGCGHGERITNNEPLDYVAPESAFAVINGFATAWFACYLKNDAGSCAAMNRRPLRERARYVLSQVQPGVGSADEPALPR